MMGDLIRYAVIITVIGACLFIIFGGLQP